MPMKPAETPQVRRRVKVLPPTREGHSGAAGKPSAARITLSPDRKATGRHTHLLDQHRMQKLRDALIAGNTIENSCTMAGIGERSFYRWMQEAESAPEGHPLWQFRQSVKSAMAEAEHRNVMIIQKAAVTSWQAAAWFLERRNPKAWGRKDSVSLGGNADAPPIAMAHAPEARLSRPQMLTALKNILKRVEEKRT